MQARFAIALLALTLSAPAIAGGVFKCVDGQGHVTFSFVSCPAAPDPRSVAPELSEEEQRAEARAKLREIQRELDHAHRSIRNYQKAQDNALIELESNVSPDGSKQRRALRTRYQELISEQLERIDELRRERKAFATSAKTGPYHS